MKDIKITAMARAVHTELMEQFELPQENPCCVKIGQSWISHEAACPEGFCPSAWNDLYPYVFALSHGAERLYGAWMKKPGTAMVSCSDGFRPVSFLLETLEE